MKLVGLVGEIGAGKGTWSNHLEMAVTESMSVHRVRFSDILRETCTLWNMSPTRKNLQLLSCVMDDGFGPGTLSNAIKGRIEKMEGLVIVDGVRWLTDEKLIRELSGIMVYITTFAHFRWSRVRNRNENPGDADKTYEQFRLEERAETEIYIPQIGSRADWKFDNIFERELLRADAYRFARQHIL